VIVRRWNRVTTLSFVLLSPQPRNKMNSCWPFPCEMMSWMPRLCLWSLPLCLSTVDSHSGPRSSDVPTHSKSFHASTYHSLKNKAKLLHSTRPYRLWGTSSRYVLLIHSLAISRNSAVVIATGYGLNGRPVGVRVPVGSGISPSPRRPDRLWGPLSLLFNWHQRSPFPESRGMKLNTHLQWCRGQEIIDLYIHSPHKSSWRSA
jgi:hypothetical protein